MIILGIDPGTARCGYGVIEEKSGEMALLDCGLIETHPGQTDAFRLKIVFDGIVGLIERHSPDVISVEQLFYGANSQTAMKVGQARGVILLAAASSGVETAEYTPLQVKQAVVGYGKADKSQVLYMVKTILKMKEDPATDDTSDALAIAICHANSRRMRALTEV
jgi:crossover junction endodeoxyribonuclease RuvC